MTNALTLKVKESVYSDSFKSDADDSTNKISYTIENGDQIINTNDGLTLQEVYDVLVAMLNGDLDFVREALFFAQEMVDCGAHIAQESQLSKHDVYKMRGSLKNISTSTCGVKLLPNAHEDNIRFRKNRKRFRGRE